ncbi:hypothetical protein K438DRAFT_2079445 [Mycena galopus ATCC 62051]|nr:hypothetical protein K438DRAFT_2079445 [Mycena galopus ATCC 62051]
MVRVRKLIHSLPWAVSHDNMNVPLRVFSQGLTNQSQFVNGCAYTVWILPLRAALPLDTNRILQAFRAENCLEVSDYTDVLYGDPEADAGLQAFDEHYVLRILLDSPDFGGYSERKDPLLNPPAPVFQLQGGPENTVTGHILRASSLEGSTYEGTLKIIEDTFNQLHMNSTAEQKCTSSERVIAWIGDQLTIEHLRGLWKYRHEDHNSFDRLDYMVQIFGWFHLVMAFANSLHKQYLGTSASIGAIRHSPLKVLSEHLGHQYSLQATSST